MKTHTPVLRGVMQDAKIRWHGTDAKRLAVITKHLEGKEIELTLRAKPKRCSPNQRKYYWSVIVGMIAEAIGITEDEAHEGLKERFLTVPGDGPLKIIRSTESLTTAEREEYHRQCRQFGDEWLHIYIPLPN